MTLYKYYGLLLSVPFAIPDMVVLESGNPDVVIAFGYVDEPERFLNSSSSLFFVASDNYIFKMDDGLLVQVRSGAEIRLHCDAAAWPGYANNLPYILGPVFSAVLQQRGTIVLHASVVQGDDAILAIAGPSGAGKSTLACQFLLEGYALIADDICAMTISERGSAQVYAAVPRLKLLPDSGPRLEISLADCLRISDNTEKRAFYVEPARFAQQGDVQVVLVLHEQEDSELVVKPLYGSSKVEALIGNMFWKDYVRGMQGFPQLFQQCVTLAPLILMYEIYYDKKCHSPQKIVAGIRESVIGFR